MREGGSSTRRDAKRSDATRRDAKRKARRWRWQRRRCSISHHRSLNSGAQVRIRAKAKEFHQAIHLELVAWPHVRVEQRSDEAVRALARGEQ